MKTFKTTIIFIFLICFFSSSFASNHDAEFLEITKEYKLNADGSTTYTYHKKVKLNTYRATQRLFGEDFIVYNPKYQKLKINKSVTTMRSGRQVETPANGYNDVLPRGAMNDPTYNYLREMVVTHTALEIGSVVDFSYTLENCKCISFGLMGTEIFAENNPVKEYNVKVSVPENIDLQYELINCDKEPEISVSNSMKTYIWKMENIKAIIAESNSADMELFQPALVFSSLKNWDKVKDHLITTIEKGAISNPIMKDKVSELLEGKNNPIEKMLILQDFVASKTGQVNIDLDILGYQAKSAEKTFNENTGTSWDKTIMLTLLLREAGLKAYSAFVSSGEFCKNVSSMTQFNTSIVVCNIDGINNYLSPVRPQKNNLKASLSGKTLLRLSKGLKTLDKIENQTHNTNKQAMNINLKLDDDNKLSGTGTHCYRGIYNPYYKLHDNNNYTSSIIDPCFNSIKSENCNFSILSQSNTIINSELVGDKELEENDGYFYWEFPVFPGGFQKSGVKTDITNRTTPLDIIKPFTECYNITLNIPENINMLTPLKKKIIKKDFGEVSFEIVKMNNRVTIKKCLVIKRSLITPEEYLEFKKIMSVWTDNNYSKLVFEKK